jgi:cytochrome P450
MLGPIARYLRDPYATLPYYAARFGDPFFLPIPGTKGTVATGDPTLIRALFSAVPDTFEPLATEAHRKVMGERGFFARSDPEQRSARRRVQAALVGARLRAMAGPLGDAVMAHVRTWRDGDVVDMRKLGKTFALCAVTNALFGVRAPLLQRHLQATFASSLERTSPVPLYIPLLRHEFGGVGPWARAQRMLRGTMALLADEIATRTAAGQTGDGITGALMTPTEDGSVLAPDEVRDLLYDLAIAGYDTSASALAWACYELARAPAVQDRLATEIAPLGARPDPDALTQLPYLDAVCNEVLRRRPILVLVSRRLRAPLELGGYRLSPGMGVSAAIGVTHFRSDLYPEPLAFRPERFLARSFSPFEYLPFGGGAKRCLGASLALLELKVALAAILTHVELRPLPGAPLRARAQGVSISPARPVLVEVSARRFD